MASKETIGKMFLLLGANWPTYEWTQATLTVYERCLMDLSDDLLEAAVLQCIGTCTFFPKVAEVRAAAFDIALAHEGLPSAMEAWQEVKRNVRASQVHRRWSHEMVVRALDTLGGLEAFGQSETDQEASWRARFVQAYETFAKRQRDEAMMLPQVREVVRQLAEGKRIPERLGTG